MNYFEKLLERKSKEENTNDYYTQWNYDKEIYKDILLGVRDYYPNYTDHGIKHSETILINILRLFGEETLDTLSSLDIWLLLEAAYLHDCGMYISRDEAKKVISEEGFIRYFNEINSNFNHPMHIFTKYFRFDIKENKFEYESKIYDTNHEYAIKFLISAYKRKTHAQDLNKIDEFQIKRKLLPERIYLILYSLSKSHGEDFKKVLELPRKETGIGKEMGHPIFISCLLRIGDLLDIDNNRISPNLLKNIESIIPEDSKYHLAKHKAITHFWIDREKIEITATINSGKESYDIAEITGYWFEQIQEEYNNQLYNWKKIIPENFNGILPTLGNLQVNILDYEYIDSKSKPKFTVDINNILNLLMGTSIYDKKEKALREIIQNSIDATYLRVYEEKKDKSIFLKEFSLRDMKSLFIGKEIEIEINKKIEKSIEDKINNYWDIIIRDKGIGIDKEKLKYILEAGSSYKDIKKNLIIEKMPFWLSPSGNFGIGFQSIFMLTERVKIKSKYFYNLENIDVELLKPSIDFKNGGNVYFKKVIIDYRQDVGTELKFEYITKKIGKTFFRGRLNNYIETFDPLITKEHDGDIFRLIEMINRINSYSLVNIKLKKDGKTIELLNNQFIKKNLDIKLANDEKFQVFIQLGPRRIDDNGGGIKYYYRNQEISEKNYRENLEHLYVFINILGYKANEVLELSRDKVKNEFLLREKKNIIEAIYKEIEKEYIAKFENLDEIFKFKICSFYFHYIKEVKSREIDKKIIDFFYNYNYNYIFSYNHTEGNINTTISIMELKKEQEIIIKKIEGRYGPLYFINKIEISPNVLKIFLKELFREDFYILNCKEINKEFGEVFLEKVEKDQEKLYLEYDLRELFKISHFFDGFSTFRKISVYYETQNSCRFFIFCNEKNKKLKLKEKLYLSEIENKISYVKINRLEDWNIFNDIFERNYILFPFFVKNSENVIWNENMEEKYIAFCHKHRADEALSIEEIATATKEFVAYLEDELKRINVEIVKD